MKKLCLLLLLLSQNALANSTDEAFFDFNRFWNWQTTGSTSWPNWPLYDGLSAVAGINENPNAAWDRPWRHKIDIEQWISGGGSLRSEFRGFEVSGGNPNRAEVVRFNLGAFNGTERWYAFSTYLAPEWNPLFTGGPTIDPNGKVIFQIHSLPDGGEAGHPPSVYLEVRDNTKQYSITIDYNPNVNSGGLPQTRNRMEIGDWRNDIGKWVDWVVHVVFACDGTDAGGVTQVWKDGWLAVNLTGGNCYNDAGEHFFRLGAYGSWWGTNPPPGLQRLVVLHDSVRIGNSTRNFNWAKPKRMLARNGDTPWATAGISRGNGMSVTAGVPKQFIWGRAGERTTKW